MRIVHLLLASFIALFLFTTTDSAAQAPPYILQWGTPGAGDGQFNFPRRLAVSADGTVYVSDRNNARVQKFTSTGAFIAKWGTLGSAPGEFDFPFGIAVTPANTFIYTAERNNNRIQKFNPDGTFLLEWGTFGSGDGEFNFPIAIDVNAAGNVYVGDSFNHRIQRFNANGQFLGKWGSQGSATGQFVNPIGIAVDADGRVYVGDSGNHRIQKFTASGVFVTAWGSQGSGDGEFQSPRGVGVDADGNIYVADTINNRIQKFTANGVFVAKWGSFGDANGQFNRPEDVEADGSGNLYVADPSNNRVQKFGLQTVPVTLSALSIVRVGSSAMLRWHVGDHAIDHVAFVVMRESAGEPRRAISTSLRGERNYKFTDMNAPARSADYWLHEIADNGNSVMHGPVTLPIGPAPQLEISAVFPNPFNPSTTVAYTVPLAGRVRVAIVDVSGRIVRTVVDRHAGSGANTTEWDGRDNANQPVASGTYFVRVDFAGRVQSRRVTLLK